MSALIEALGTAWRTGNPRARDEAAAALGLELAEPAITRITRWLEVNNGKLYVLTHADVVRAILDAIASPHGIAIRHGGRAGPHSRLFSTLALAVVRRDRSDVVVGIGQAAARAPSPTTIVGHGWDANMVRNVPHARAWAAIEADDRVAIAFTEAPERSVPSADALLANILAHPDDDAPRLVYADHLLQAGDPRGELIALQCARAQTDAMAARERALLRKHRMLWSQDAIQFGSNCVFRRGFVAELTASPAAFATDGAVLFERTPLETLVVAKPSAQGLRALGAAPHLARLRTLRFADTVPCNSDVHVRHLRAFLASPHLGAIRELALDLCVLPSTAEAIGEALAAIDWPGVERLALRIQVSPQICLALRRAKLPRLVALAVDHPHQLHHAAFPAATVTGL